MVTQNPRINVVLEPALHQTLSQLAKKAGVSISLLSRDLIKDALEVREDMYWHKMTQERDETFSIKESISHENIWSV